MFQQLKLGSVRCSIFRAKSLVRFDQARADPEPNRAARDRLPSLPPLLLWRTATQTSPKSRNIMNLLRSSAKKNRTNYQNTADTTTRFPYRKALHHHSAPY